MTHDSDQFTRLFFLIVNNVLLRLLTILIDNTHLAVDMIFKIVTFNDDAL